MSVQEPTFIKANQNLSSIPGDKGLPLIGHTLEIINDPLSCTKRLYEEYGPLAKVNILGSYRALALHPDIVQEIYLDKEHNFSNYLGYNFWIGQLFSGGLFTRDFEDHRHHRRIIQRAFKKPYMQSYLEQMTPLIHKALDEWAAAEKLDFFVAAKNLSLDIALSLLLGIGDCPEKPKIIKSYNTMAKPASGRRLTHHSIPGNAMWKGNRARKYLRSFFSDLVADKRGSNDEDMFSILCKESLSDGSYLSHEEIVDHLLLMLIASHDTISAALTNMVYSLIDNPQWQDTARDEVSSIPSSSIHYDDLDKLAVTEKIFNETLRLYRPAAFSPRRTIEQCTLQNVVVPKNVEIDICPLFIHRMNELWDNPDTFNPEHLNNLNEKHPYAFFPFGGGTHKCIGMHFAYLEMKVIMFYLLRKYRLTSENKLPTKFDYLPFPKPKGKVSVTLNRLH